MIIDNNNKTSDTFECVYTQWPLLIPITYNQFYQKKNIHKENIQYTYNKTIPDDEWIDEFISYTLSELNSTSWIEQFLALTDLQRMFAYHMKSLYSYLLVLFCLVYYY
eukprot:GHVR01076122.1.p1 GENE.GHVR01076122.1~~GHVR01076122.1.p1  ORF type:complete len:108 (-),score=16.75 GHVR01076122.1:448-771(-)